MSFLGSGELKREVGDTKMENSLTTHHILFSTAPERFNEYLLPILKFDEYFGC